MFRQVDITEASLTQFLTHFILSETTARVEVLPFRGVKYCFIFDIFEIIFKILCAIGVEEPHIIKIKQFFDVIKGDFFVSGFYLEGFAIVA